MKTTKIYLGIMLMLALIVLGCSNENLNTDDTALNQTALDVAQTSGQLASGTNFTITGSSSDSVTHPDGGPRRRGHHGRPGVVDGTNLLAPTDELLAIVDAESASDFRGLRISKQGGATITHYNASGTVVQLPIPGPHGPQGCSFSGSQYPDFDSLLSSVVKTVIDFGSGVTFRRDTVTITRSGKIVIERSVNGDTRTEITTFQNYTVNGIGIEGTKTRISTFDEGTGTGSSSTSVSGGKFTFADGTQATWTSEKSRVSQITINATTGRPESGTITTEVATTVTGPNGIIYSHATTKPLIENVACQFSHRAPVSGVLKTIYKNDTVEVDYGDGTCSNRSITITLNGVSTSKTIGG